MFTARSRPGYDPDVPRQEAARVRLVGLGTPSQLPRRHNDAVVVGCLRRHLPLAALSRAAGVDRLLPAPRCTRLDALPAALRHLLGAIHAAGQEPRHPKDILAGLLGVALSEVQRFVSFFNLFINNVSAILWRFDKDLCILV